MVLEGLMEDSSTSCPAREIVVNIDREYGTYVIQCRVRHEKSTLGTRIPSGYIRPNDSVSPFMMSTLFITA